MMWRAGTPVFFLFFLCQLISQTAAALAKECYTYVGCIGGRSGSPSSNPSYGNQIRLNPSAVPVEKGLGLEGILYSNEIDVSLVRGLGRIGAAISPSNSEETFFGPPGIEWTEDYLRRKQRGEKFPNQKVTLAVAFDLLKRKGSGLKTRGIQMGLMGKYNQYTKNVRPGAGLNAVAGPLLAGISYYQDETRLDVDGWPNEYSVIRTHVVTYNGGLSLGSVMLDYSVLRLETEETQIVSTVRLLTASLLFKRLILTASQRTEDSAREMYNFSTRQLEPKKVKEDFFGGVQVHLNDHLMMGVLYNYYLLHEASVSATLFF